KILAGAIAAYRRTKAGNLIPYPHVRSTLIKLKELGLKLAIVSDAPRMQAWLRLAEMGLSDFFDTVVTFDDTGEKKPSAKPFEAVIQKLGVKPSQIIFIGDDLEKDVAGAQNTGMKSALAKYGASKYTLTNDKIKPDFELESLRDLLAVLKK
ncbi:MAG: HAD-IA family hydrolase, partial [Candidatus Diapherotrites archaeon]|nr:HAD-IA family hydrolase [Candidatus Diapherotrites archaeon]